MAKKPRARARRGPKDSQSARSRPGSREAEADARLVAQGKFLEVFAQNGNVTDSAEAAGISRRTHYLWLAQWPAYAARFQDSTEQAADALEREARLRAIDGVDEPVFYQGLVCGYVRRKSDGLLMFMLKGRRREVYGDRTELTGKGGGPIATVDLTKVPLNDVRELERILASAEVP